MFPPHSTIPSIPLCPHCVNYPNYVKIFTMAWQRMTKKNVLSLEETLEALGGIGRSTLYRRIDKGQITPRPKPPGSLIHTRLEFDRSEIDRYLANPPQRKPRRKSP